MANERKIPNLGALQMNPAYLGLDTAARAIAVACFRQAEHADGEAGLTERDLDLFVQERAGVPPGASRWEWLATPDERAAKLLRGALRQPDQSNELADYLLTRSEDAEHILANVDARAFAVMTPDRQSALVNRVLAGKDDEQVSFIVSVILGGIFVLGGSDEQVVKRAIDRQAALLLRFSSERVGDALACWSGSAADATLLSSQRRSNLVRHVAEAGGHGALMAVVPFAEAPRDRALLVEGLLDGWTGDDESFAILAALGCRLQREVVAHLDFLSSRDVVVSCADVDLDALLATLRVLSAERRAQLVDDLEDEALTILHDAVGRLLAERDLPIAERISLRETFFDH